MSRTLRRLIPSPAMIVALVALVMSLGSSAYALGLITSQEIKDDDVTGVDIKERSLHGHDLRKNSVGRLAINESRLRSVRAKGLRFWAVVNANADLVRGSKHLTQGDVSRFQSSTGIYQVIFDRDVSLCSYQATPPYPGAGSTVGEGQITASALPGNPNGVRVRTAGIKDNVEADNAFQLAVIC